MSYPSEPIFNAINVDSRTSNTATETRSGRTQVRSIGAQRWSFSAGYNQLSRQEFAPVFAFIMTLQGRLNSFTIVPPVIAFTSGDATGAIIVDGNTTQGSASANIEGISGTLKAGDLIKFANHSKVYMLTADRAGVGAITFQPPLVETVPDNAVVTYNSVPFTMRLNNDVQQYSLGGYDAYEYEVDMVEVL